MALDLQAALDAVHALPLSDKLMEPDAPLQGKEL